MSKTFLFQGTFKLLGLLGCVALLGACGGGGGATPVSNNGNPSSPASVVASSSSSSITADVTSVAASSASSSVPADVAPDAFSFTPVLGAPINSSITSATITISGVTSASPISITGGQYAINGGAPTGNAGTINNGQTVTVTLSTSATANTTTQAVVTIGGVTGVFAATTSNLVGGAIQGPPLNVAGAVSTFAGGTAGNADGVSLGASFNWPFGITSDGPNLYVADGDNQKIRKIVIATGVVTTLAGSGTIGDADGIGTMASFHSPYGITTDGINVYVADAANNKIRKIELATGIVTTIAGSGAVGKADGTGTAASFYLPLGITSDGANLYVADSANHNIRKIVIATGVVTTLAGTGSIGDAEGTGTGAAFSYPNGVTTDGVNVYVTDTSNNRISKIVIGTGVVTTLAGSLSSGSTDGIGSAAKFYSPTGITCDGTNLYVVDRYNQKIRKIVILTGVVTTIAGSGLVGSVDGTGSAASFNNPNSITTDGVDLYVTGQDENKIRKIH